MRAHPVALGALGSVTEDIIKTAVNVGRFGSLYFLLLNAN